MFVSARAEQDARVRGLALGADDYVVKPFSMRELILRVGAVLRRATPVEMRLPPPVPGVSAGCVIHACAATALASSCSGAVTPSAPAAESVRQSSSVSLAAFVLTPLGPAFSASATQVVASW